MPLRPRILSCAWAVLCMSLAGVVACDGQVTGPGTSGGTRKTTTPRPDTTGSQDPGKTGTSPTPPPGSQKDNSKVGGNLEESAPPSNSVRFVAVEPAQVSLNAPSTGGSNPAGFASSRVLRAVATLTGGGTASADVTWSTSDSGRLAVEDSGLVSVKAGAATGSAIVYAESKAAPGVKGAATVTVTADGLLRISVLPALSGEAAAFAQTDVVARRQGNPVAGGPAQGTLDLRVAAGTGYRILVNRKVASDSVGAIGGYLLSTAVADPVEVPLNSIATVSVTLQATDSLAQ